MRHWNAEKCSKTRSCILLWRRVPGWHVCQTKSIPKWRNLSGNSQERPLTCRGWGSAEGPFKGFTFIAPHSNSRSASPTWEIHCSSLGLNRRCQGSAALGGTQCASLPADSQEDLRGDSMTVFRASSNMCLCFWIILSLQQSTFWATELRDSSASASCCQTPVLVGLKTLTSSPEKQTVCHSLCWSEGRSRAFTQSTKWRIYWAAPAPPEFHEIQRHSW